ncbi:hypothetical protein [Sphingosinicella sp. LY1275]|uniref:hypothetical protein n=1 Tax=Sphingosinicella sp. LY1275 TaxID=3095379 RepID=UPI002ADEE6CA|nr:hypothetical protein [Sphingosinicella sp. LY1275]MEA1013534.1 hypothetical protein [Sphingosinicella sp. LY1275]
MLRPQTQSKDAAAHPSEGSEDDGRHKKNRLIKGVAFGIGSAAIVAALLYANRSKRNG